MPVSINGSGSITGVSSLTQLTKLGVTGILTATDFSGPSGGAADFPNGLTATTASFSGNLTVGGVLTYDDVTNIDSVGVITARDGLHVTGGKVSVGSDNPSGNLNISYLQVGKGQVSSDHSLYNYNTSFTNNAYQNGNGTFAHITSRPVGVINLQDNALTFSNGPGGTVGQSATLTERFRVTSDGKVRVPDNGKFTAGASDDLQMHHTSNDSFITHTGPGQLFITNETSGQDVVLRADNGGSLATYLRLDSSHGEVKLNHAGSLKLATKSNGIEVSGDQVLNGHLDMRDSDRIRLGASDDLQIFHNGSANYIDNTSDLYVRVNGSETAIYATANGKVALNYDSSNRIETTATGVEVSGATKTDTLEVTQEYPTIRPTLDLNFAATKVLDDRITFTRDGVGTYTDDMGILKYASNNTPRFDHDPTTGESLGLLVEESRTNYEPYSVDINTGKNHFTGSTLTANAATSPDGTTTATRITGSGTDENTRLGWDTQSTSNTQYNVFSAFVKADSGTPILGFYTNTFVASNVAFNIDLSDGTTNVINNNSGFSSQVVAYPNGWYRVSLIGGPGNGSGGSWNINLVPSLTSARGASSGSNASASYLIWGVQEELGTRPLPTSYIPTSGSTVTRGQDSAKITGINLTDFYNQPEGTIFADYKVIQGDPDIFYLSNGQSSRRIGLYEAGSSQTRFLIGNSGTQADTTDSAGTTVGDNIKSAGAYKLNDIVAAKNGAISSTDSSATIPDGIDRAYMGGYYEGTAEGVLGLRRLSYYNKRLPNAQLQGLTQQ